MDILQDVIQTYMPAGKSSGKCVSINCPMCVSMGESRADTRQRGGIFFEFDETGYNCFNCGFTMRQPHSEPLRKSTKMFLREMGVPTDRIQQIVFNYMKNESSENKLKRQVTANKTFISKPINLNFVEVELPPDTHLLHDIVNDVDANHPALKAYSYADDRGISDYPFLMWSSSRNKNLDEYLIIPFIYNGSIVGYQARYTGEDKNIIKYRRFINSNPNKGFLFGIENIFSDNRYLIINESLIDAIPYNGIGLMKHNINQDHVNLLSKFKGRIILVPDFGSGGKHLIDIACNNGWSVYFPFWDKEYDLGDATSKFGRLFMVNEITKNAEESTMQIRIKSNLMI